MLQRLITSSMFLFISSLTVLLASARPFHLLPRNQYGNVTQVYTTTDMDGSMYEATATVYNPPPPTYETVTTTDSNGNPYSYTAYVTYPPPGPTTYTTTDDSGNPTTITDYMTSYPPITSTVDPSSSSSTR
jgi:hypothetical protein